ncbi:hypothetical protein [Facklamia sp. P12955]|uniref:hypothetical protein n=1 Tax=Facklamia sp. P12955 TaxID=3421946 RepID=UPI003D17B756
MKNNKKRLISIISLFSLLIMLPLNTVTAQLRSSMNKPIVTTNGKGSYTSCNDGNNPLQCPGGISQ